ncbi:efflux RND transporter periplasmic adaptor subunit [Fusobacterium sp.]|uniref:efflux RND transporter periplasmic adaptor subunit n=1 Tax=Fusobacterium sp. TaxID=68766 RepID=UPI0025C39A5F|nr:efflux RND transporter periplasmic adaptor subunit [Fusobacterium sp.]MCI7224383.1 efflux RND transporter periplasmic adaptor subunit [Fusobacterium sp.]
MNVIKKYLKLIIVASLVILGSTCYTIFKKPKDEVKYLTETVKKGNISQTITASGTVRSSNRVEVGAQVSGKITSINVSLGQEVKKGDLIATIDSLTQNNNLEEAKSKLKSYEAQRKSAKVKLQVASSKFNRMSNLYREKSISQDDYESSKEELEIAKASVAEYDELIAQASISVKTAETNLSYTTITSPIDGVIISIPVSVGQTVNSNQSAPTIVQVADINKMLIKAEVAEGDITKVKNGMEVEISSLANPELKYKSTVQSVDLATSTLTDDEYSESVSNSSAVYYYANIILDNTDNNLRIGMTTTNTITIKAENNILLVPTVAVQKVDNKNIVKVLREKNQVETREVIVGISDGLSTEIKDGLKEGEEIIVTQLSGTEGLDRMPQRRF